MILFCIEGGVTGIYKIGKKVEFLPKLYFFGVGSGGQTTIDLERLERTNGNFVGISWEKLGTFGVVNEGVTILFGNFVGITWE